MDAVKTRADSVITFLHTGLTKVYSGAERDQNESIRTLLNLQFFTRAVERSVFVNAAAIHFKVRRSLPNSYSRSSSYLSLQRS